MNKLFKYGVFLAVSILSACSTDMETIDLASVPDIPDDMLHEQSQIQNELSKDKQQVLDELNKQEN